MVIEGKNEKKYSEKEHEKYKATFYLCCVEYDASYVAEGRCSCCHCLHEFPCPKF